MTGSPSISAVIVTRDRPLLLRDAFASAAAQVPAPLEIVVVDDGDSAVEPSMLEGGALEVRVIPCTARRAAPARNLGARAARGKLLAFLDDDDRWLPGHLAGLSSALAADAPGLAYRDVAVVREQIESGNRVELARRVIARDWDPALMRTDDYISPSALALTREWFDRLGGFDPSFRYSEDWDLLLRAARLGAPRRVPGVTVEVRMRESGHASLESGPERRECLDRLAERHGLPALEIKTFWEVAEAVTAAAAR